MTKIPKSVSAYYQNFSGLEGETLLEMRSRILFLLPTAVEKMKYAMPTFEVDGEDICGLMVHKKHLGFYPYSGSVLNQLPEIAEKYSSTKGALHIPFGKPLPRTIVKKLINVRMRQIKENKISAPKSTDKTLRLSVWQTIGLAAPAQRALAGAKINSLEKLSKRTESEISALHGIGKNALTALIKEMEKSGLQFRK